jgi:hypothetical protein
MQAQNGWFAYATIATIRINVSAAMRPRPTMCFIGLDAFKFHVSDPIATPARMAIPSMNR